MWKFLQYRSILKSARECLHQATHVVNMRGDILGAALLGSLEQARVRLLEAVSHRMAVAVLAERCDELADLIGKASRKRRFPVLAENFEVLVVAVAVAMAFRAYLVQPFQIPTGSMQPTLYGIHAWEKDPSWTDRIPVKYVKWLITGEWYRDVRSPESGYLSPPFPAGVRYPSHLAFSVGGKTVRIPKDARLLVLPGMHVKKGDRLWSGIEKAGDHVFVDKVTWNFRRPKRGEIMVFKTDGIPALPQGTYYIKRLIGRPGESVRINEPDIVIDGNVVREPEGIRRIAEMDQGYAGYRVVGPVNPADRETAVLRTQSDLVRLDDTQYLAFGDNTLNSRDSRYWGPVPQANLVGPAWVVYWPASVRWGRPK